MSGYKASTQLERQLLDGSNVTRELADFARWLEKGQRFLDIHAGCSKCIDDGKNEAIRPLLKELGFKETDPKLRFNVFRITGGSYLNPGSCPGGYLILIRTETGANPTISYPSTPSDPEPATQLVLGERVYFDRRVVVKSSFDCVVVTVD
jgi:hypothetical protein